MFGLGLPELILILVIVLMIFGAGKFPEVASAIGKSIKNFKKATSGIDEGALTASQEDKKKKGSS